LLKPLSFAIRALEAMELVGEERGILSEIRKANKAGKQEDMVARTACGLKEGKANSVHSAEWSLQDQLLCFRGKIYIPNEPDLHHCIVEQHHNSKPAGHPGHWKTLELVARNYWWPQMLRYIGQYCKTCDLCMCTKI